MTSIQDNECLILVFVLTREDDKFVKVVNCSICDEVEITHFFNQTTRIPFTFSVDFLKQYGGQEYLNF